jgi:bile acid:Na+ symporter, BASS family
VDEGVITRVALPITLGVVMFGLGLGLSVADFRRVAAMPRTILLCLVLQGVVLNGICFLLCIGLRLAPEIAVGMMLLSAAPGGVSANLFSHLAKGDVALNITLTAINSVTALVTLPITVALALHYFAASVVVVPPPVGKVVEVTLIVVLPVVLAMLLRAQRPALTSLLMPWVRTLSITALVAMSGVAIWRGNETLVLYATEVIAACLGFNLISLAIGYGVPRALGLARPQAVAITMEIGLHNAALAIFVAIAVLGNAQYAIPAAFYSVLMVVTAGVFVWWQTRIAPPLQQTMKH